MDRYDMIFNGTVNIKCISLSVRSKPVATVVRENLPKTIGRKEEQDSKDILILIW